MIEMVPAFHRFYYLGQMSNKNRVVFVEGQVRAIGIGVAGAVIGIILANVLIY